LEYLSPSIQIPWGQITHYRGRYVEEDQLKILAAAPSLVECALASNFDEFDPHVPPIVLPSLRRLRVHTLEFLPYFTAPMLEGLFSVYNLRRDVIALGSFLDNSSCALQKLVLMDCALSSELITVLRGLSDLIYLLIEFDGDAEVTEQQDLFNALTISGTSRHLCPKLASLVYGFNKEFPHDSFFAMARSRFQINLAGPCLTQLLLFDAYKL
jgi:hypothetical protein